MRKPTVILLCLMLVLTVFLMTACQGGGEPAAQEPDETTEPAEPAKEPEPTQQAEAEEPEPEFPTEIPPGLKIGYGVSTLNNAFHQSHAEWAKKYAKEEYGAEVQIFDGQSDANVMAQNFDQAIAQGMDMVTLHIWQGESIRAAAMEAIENGMVISTYFDKIPDLPIPHTMPGEAEISFQMGKIAAEKWLEAHPDKPIKFVQIGWPDHEGVTVGRTDPFREGVLSVAPDAEDLGCMDASAGADAAFAVTQDLIQAHPDINIIYSQAADLTVGVLPALQQLGRGVMKDGVPVTEILVSVDCPETELIDIFDPNCSLKMSMGLPPIETAKVRIDTLMDIYLGKIPQLDETLDTIYIPNTLIGYWTQSSVEEAVKWYNEQFGENLEVPTYD
ncbi:MAG: sugar ABC transporter substrate-binding protein [Clostridiales bacterium]|jgi:ABC-type sugar transport system substrate-binding protein|nr:sugar ABC transporter substrate-binding protein [Clostridiales bacterium]